MPSVARAVRALLIVIAFAALATHARADPQRGASQQTFSESPTGRMLAPYLSGDQDSPDALRRLFREERETIPPPLLLALADGLLRAHKVRMAEAAFAEALTRTDEPDVALWAAFGLGWIELAAGDAAGARSRFEVIAQDGDWGAATASALVTLADASRGAGQPAAARFDATAEADGTSYSLRIATRVLSGYAYYWGGQYAAASQAFGRAAAEFPGTPLTDDAQYAAAWARYRAGQQTEAVEELRLLAGDGDAAPALAAGLMALSPDAVLRETLRGYHGAGIQQPDALLVQMLDLDGRALARAALARVDAPGGPTVAKPDLAPDDVPAVPAVVEPPLNDTPAVPARGEEGASSRARPRTHAGWLLLALLVMLAVVATRRRRQAGVTSTPWRSERR